MPEATSFALFHVPAMMSSETGGQLVPKKVENTAETIVEIIDKTDLLECSPVKGSPHPFFLIRLF